MPRPEDYVIIDAHTHLYSHIYVFKGLSTAEFVALMDRLHITKAVTFTVEGFFEDGSKWNDYIAQEVAKHPDRLIGYGTVHPWYGDEALREMERCARELKLCGFKFHPWLQGFPANSEMCLTLIQKAAQLRLPVIFHTGTPPYTEPLQVANLAREVPEAQIILGHMGLADLWGEAIHAAKRHDNLWLETSGAPPLAVRKAVERLGAERILFGTDMPFGGVETAAHYLQGILSLDLPEADRRLILGENAARLHHLKL
jgi:hypothetical protein